MRNVKIDSTSMAAVAAGDSAAAAVRVGDILVEAFLVKMLSNSGTLKLPSGDGDGDGVVTLSESLVCRILRRRSLNISKKMDFFNWCSSSSNHNFCHSAATYTAVFAAVCRSRRLHEIPALVASMKSDGVVASAVASKLLLRSLLSSGDFVSAGDILRQVEDAAGGCLDPDAYSSAVLDLLSTNQLSTAVVVFSRLLDSLPRAAVLIPRAAMACTHLLVSLRREGRRLDFEHIFVLIRDSGFGMDTWGYNICIHAFGCWGDIETALHLFDEMKTKKNHTSQGMAPDLCTYNSLIHALCRLGKMEEAMALMEELGSSAYDPDEFTFFILINGCIRSSRIEDAVRLFGEMRICGFFPDLMVYNSLIDGLFKARRVGDACIVFEEMTTSGVSPSCVTHNILIDGLIRNGRAAAGYELFCRLKKVKGGRMVDGIGYSIVVLQLCRERQLDQALKLVEDMVDKGFSLDLVTVTSLLAQFHRQGRWDWAEMLMKYAGDGRLIRSASQWESNMMDYTRSVQNKEKDNTPMFPHRGKVHDVLASLGVPPLSLRRGKRVRANAYNGGSFDVDMVNTYMSIFLSKGKLSLACKVFEVFTSMGVEPASYTYNSMVSCFVKKGYFDEVWGVLKEMGEGVCPADIATYNLIIQSLGRTGRADLANAVLDLLLSQGGHLDIVMYNTLIDSLGKEDKIYEAVRLFHQMKDEGVHPDVVTFNIIIRAHIKVGLMGEALGYLRMMLESGCAPNRVTDTILESLEKGITKWRREKENPDL